MNSYQKLLLQLPEERATLVAVSKTRPVEEIMKLYDQGQRLFGENKVQELLEKFTKLPEDIEWHLIGHLQTNKVKYIAPFIALIHSVDSLKLLLEIDREAQKNDRVIKVLIQVHIASEENKFGVDEKELFEIMEYYTAADSAIKHVEITGLMGMASNTEDNDLIEAEFAQLRSLFNTVKKTYLLNGPGFSELSMGMSNDYGLALKQGSTMVRVGSLLFRD